MSAAILRKANVWREYWREINQPEKPPIYVLLMVLKQASVGTVVNFDTNGPCVM